MLDPLRSDPALLQPVDAVVAELAERWPGPEDLLYRSMTVVNAPDWTRTVDRRRALIQAMVRGMAIESRSPHGTNAGTPQQLR
jgi:hypothetical protein